MSNGDVIGRNDANGLLALPCSKEAFGSFIADLLKSPRRISGYHHAIFDISRADIENVYHLIDQRIREQHDAELVYFRIKLFYSDRAIVTLSAIDEF